MCGRDTLTTVVSGTSMKVANMTATATIHGLTCLCSADIALLRVDGGKHRHSWAEEMLRILAGIEHDLHGPALAHLHIVAGGVLRGGQAELCPGRGSDAIDVPHELAAAERIDFDLGVLAGSHVPQLRFLEVRDDPHVAERHQGHQRLTGLYDLPDFDCFPADRA